MQAHNKLAMSIVYKQLASAKCKTKQQIQKSLEEMIQRNQFSMLTIYEIWIFNDEITAAFEKRVTKVIPYLENVKNI